MLPEQTRSPTKKAKFKRMKVRQGLSTSRRTSPKATSRSPPPNYKHLGKIDFEVAGKDKGLMKRKN